MENLIGLQIVGYRYGEAPENGKSYNYQTKEFEPGISMAQVGYYKEIGSFAISDAAENRKKYYYIGTISGFGGDDEICINNAKRLTYHEYLSLRKSQAMINSSNKIVNAIIDEKISFIKSGWDLGFGYGKGVEHFEEERNKYIKK